MRRFLAALSIGILAILAAQDSSRAQGTASSKAKAPVTQFEVLSPWADVDPIPLRGISPRIDNLAGKKIGLFVNPKRAAMPIAQSIDRRNLKFSVPGRTLIRSRSGGFPRELIISRERRSDYSSIPSGRPCRSRNQSTGD